MIIYRVYAMSGRPTAQAEKIGEYTSLAAAKDALRKALGVIRLTQDTPGFADRAIWAGYCGCDDHDDFGWIE